MDIFDSHSRQFTIQQLSEKLNIPKPTLRFWEKELEGLIVPHRTRGGQRRYTEEHIIILERIKNLRDSGKSLYDIKMHLKKGNNENRHSPYNNLDLLSEHIAKIVRIEINKLLKKDWTNYG